MGQLNSKIVHDQIWDELGLLVIDVTHLKLACSRGQVDSLTIENIFQRLHDILELYAKADTKMFRAIKTIVNQLISANPNLPGIHILIQNTRSKAPNGAPARFKTQL